MSTRILNAWFSNIGQPPSGQSLQMTRGEDLSIVFAALNPPVAITGQNFSFVIRSSLDSTVAAVTKSGSVTDGVNGLITVDLANSDTVNLTLQPTPWIWELWRSDSGSATKIAGGTLGIAENQAITISPDVPGNLQISASVVGSLVLTYTIPPGASYVNIYRNTVANTPVIFATGITDGTFVDNTVAPNTIYYYSVTAFYQSSGESANCPEQSKVSIPDITGVNLSVAQSSPSLALSWTAPPNGCTSYQIWRSTASGTETLYDTIQPISPSYTDLHVTTGVRYFYKVAAVNSSGMTFTREGSGVGP
jgi:fibronectin type 3 domain-containing protein